MNRIGQTNPTFVHRFMIRNTIEQLVYRIFKYDSAAEPTTSNAQMNTNEPGCSNGVEHVERINNYQLTINDFFNLLQTL